MKLLKKIRKCRKAISPVIATIIIIAVTIAVSVAVAGWMMGLWGGLTRTEACRISPESRFTASTKYFSLVVLNTGTGVASITSLRVGGVDYGAGNSTFPLTVNAGMSQRINGQLLSGAFTAGMSYEVHVYTLAGNDYLTSLVAA